MNQIGLSVFLNEGGVVKKIHVISKKHSTASLNLLCDPSAKIFDRLLFNQQVLSIDPSTVLSSLESSKDRILELHSTEGERKFALWRCNLSFVQDQKLGLIPERYKSYRVSQ